MFRVIILITAIFCASVMYCDTADQATGYWKSISDKQGEVGKVTAYWYLFITNNTLEGMIVHTPDGSDHDVYNCKKAEYNGKPIVGTPWMNDLKKTGTDSWGGGYIIDCGDDQGNKWGCEVKVTDNGNILGMRGFMGISLLGRTQNWQRSSLEEVNTDKLTNKTVKGSTNNTKGKN